MAEANENKSKKRTGTPTATCDGAVAVGAGTASGGGDGPSESKQPHNMQKIMEAIQQVLAEHDVGQARVVLELYEDDDGNTNTNGNDKRPMTPPQDHHHQHATSEALHFAPGDAQPQQPPPPTAAAPMRSPMPSATPPRSRSPGSTHMSSSGGGGGGGGPAASDVAGTTNTDNNTHTRWAAARTTTTTAVTISPTATAVTPTAASTSYSYGSSSPGSPLPPLQQVQSSLDASCTLSGLDSTLMPAAIMKAPMLTIGRLHTPAALPDISPLPMDEDVAAAFLAAHGAGSDDRGGGPPMPKEVADRLSHQREMDESVRVLNTFVGQSALLADKKEREERAAQRQRPKGFGGIAGYRPPTRGTSPAATTTTPTTATTPRTTATATSTATTPTAARLPAPPLTTTSTTTTTGTTAATATATAARKTSTPITTTTARQQQLRGEETTGTLPVLMDRSSLAAASRDNARRASQLSRPNITTTTGGSVGMDDDAITAAAAAGVRLPGPHPTTTTTTAAAAATAQGNSLQAMLAEQRRMETANRARLAEHATVMDKAREYIAATEATSGGMGATLSGTALLPRAVDRPTTSHTATATTLQPRPPTGSLPLPTRSLLHGRLTTPTTAAAAAAGGGGGTAATPPPAAALPPTVGSPRHSPRGSLSTPTATATGSSGGIQVVKITMPAESAAKGAVLAQLCQTPAGQQQLTTKDRYAAMLAGQTQALSENAEKKKEYRQLVERAVEFNKRLNRRR